MNSKVAYQWQSQDFGLEGGKIKRQHLKWN